MTSQLGQDRFVLEILDFKKNGYFVEFGATDGVTLSNTYLLEKEYGWGGILAEPAKIWHESLVKNRTARIDTRCVWKTSGETIIFNESKLEGPEYSSILECSHRDHLGHLRNDGDTYLSTTVTLVDMLKEHGAPRDIDYLSIDTEGSELDILTAFDFDAFNVKIITVEHNYTPARRLIYDHLKANGYVRHLEVISQWDDWYVRT